MERLKSNQFKVKKEYIFSILMIVLMSNTMFFGLIERKKTFIVFLIWGVIITIKYKTVNIRNIKIFLVISIIIIANFFLNINVMGKADVEGIMQLLIITFLTFVTIEKMDKVNFAKAYIKIMYFLAITSLIFFAIAIFQPNLAKYLYFIANHGVRQYKVSLIYTWGWNGVFTRNAGAFWEPGAYQGFLNIAFILTLRYKQYIKNSNIKLLIFAITILTTQSTTGYIIFISILILFYKDINTYKGKYKIFINMLIVILVCSGITIIASTNNINNKFANGNGSKVIRTDDLKNSLKMIEDRPIRGYGIGNFKNMEENQHNIHNNSNGLLYLFYSQGIIFFIFYLYRMKKGITKNFDVKKEYKKYYLYVVFIVLFLTEGLAWLPFYIMFLFEFKEEKKNESLLY